MCDTKYDKWVSRNIVEVNNMAEQGETCDLLGGEICPYTSCDDCPANGSGERI